jgi:quinol monooxygenase YgiN
MTLTKEADHRTASPVTVVMSFTVLPGREDIWRDAWSEVARLATRRSACHHSRLLQDRDDTTRCAMLSEWDSLSDFDRFVREMGLIWLERVTAYSRTQPQINIFELIHQGSARIAGKSVAQEAMALA